MRMKTFSAGSMSTALKLVEEQMGKDAIILSSREDKIEGIVHVTAGLDPDFVASPVVIRTTEPPKPQKVIRPAFAAPAVLGIPNEILDSVATLLQNHGIPQRSVLHLLQSSALFPDSNPCLRSVLAFCLGRHIRCVSLWDKDYQKKPIVFLGAPGAGKTVAIAKLATQALLQDNRPALISSDVAKAGGIEQLEHLTRILKVRLHIAEDQASLNQALRQNLESTTILIDTQGLHAYDDAGIARFQSLFPADNYGFVLVAGPSENLDDHAALIEKLGPAYRPMGLLPTKLDTSKKLGNIVNMALTFRLPIFELGVSPSVTHGLMTSHPDTIARLLENQQGSSS